MASPEQALCDFVHLLLRKYVDPRAVVTFRNLSHIRRSKLTRIAANYPPAAAVYVQNLLGPV